MNISINKEVSQEKYDKIMALLAEEKGIWKPKYGEKYYAIDGDSEIMENNVIESGWDSGALSIGNFYQTEAEAKAKIEWLKAVQRIKEYIAREFELFIPDFNDKKEVKCRVSYDYYEQGLVPEFSYTVHHYNPIGYIRPSDFQQLIKDCQADLLIVFNIK